MKISVIRHGRSLCTENHPVTAQAFRNWVEKYNRMGVFEEAEYNSIAIKAIENANFILTSDYKRAIQSANLLGCSGNVEIHAIFREAELPLPPLNRLRLKLRPVIWSVLFRCLWLLGVPASCESLTDARERAVKAADLLISYAEEHQSVVLVGHAFFNRLIGVELMKRGWKGQKPGSKNWSCSTYHYG
ncbi:histidine phosphatase family protein [Bacillus massilinigeriensis]|uniref:histidine phosphatase family protein n=1 Tax=Bacillus mediterraneensis TaxID=1805474 RepID=UPI0008F8F501|nr:histidine phosphatase family protein [Bacillus mediterraneensis]